MSIQLYEQDLTKHRRGYMCKSTDVANLPHNADIELPEESRLTLSQNGHLALGEHFLVNATGGIFAFKWSLTYLV